MDFYRKSRVLLFEFQHPQPYYKAISDARILLMALGEIVTDEKVKRNANAVFEKNKGLREACRE